jgi:hypothetical protein
MRRISMRIGVALLAFLTGVVANTVRVRCFAGSPKGVVSSFSSRDDEWHRFYEAAQVSRDEAIMRRVGEKLFCANRAGIPDAERRDIQDEVWCQKADGTIHPHIEDGTSRHEYGPYYQRIRDSHSRWMTENLEFLRTIGTATKARAYLATHELPSNEANR